jgi:hypothetical protein
MAAKILEVLKSFFLKITERPKGVPEILYKKEIEKRKIVANSWNGFKKNVSK